MIKNISVIGAGTMGHSIAMVFAMHDYQVSLYEEYENVRTGVMDKIGCALTFLKNEDYITEADVEKTLQNIKLFSDLKDAVVNADYVIEATPEILELKQDLFQKLDGFCPEHTIFASNTSSLPLSKMIEKLSENRKKRTMVCHWYNPAHLIPIAELSYFGNMDESVFDEVYEVYVKSEKKPIKVLKDIPGLVANRMLHALAREIFSMIEKGVASPEDIDKALKFGPGFRAATTGQLEIADMGGLDLWCAVEDTLFKEIDKAQEASPLLREKVKDGKLGIKTGEGFYKYETEEDKKKALSDFQKRLLIQLKTSKNY